MKWTSSLFINILFFITGIMSVEDENLYRLEGSAETTGGLIIKKGSAPGTDDFKFKKPSLFGLDKLARAYIIVYISNSSV